MSNQMTMKFFGNLKILPFDGINSESNQLTIENQTTTERYLKTIEKTKTLESQIASLRNGKNNFQKSNENTTSLISQIKTLKTALNTQIGDVSILSPKYSK